MNPIEPSASIRSAARELREIFVALLAEGFTGEEALVIIRQMMANNRTG